MVGELAPGNKQESQRVVVKSVVTMNVGRHLQLTIITPTFLIQYSYLYSPLSKLTRRAEGNSFPVTEILGAEMPSAKEAGRNLEWAIMEAPQ